MAWDVAMMLPMLEMCTEGEIECIRDVMYIYNDRNPEGDDKIDQDLQISTDEKIKSKKPYPRNPR